MLISHDTMEGTCSRKFSNINQHPKYNPQKKEDRNSFQPSQTLTRHPPVWTYNTTLPTSKRDNNARNSVEKRKAVVTGNQTTSSSPAPNAESKQTSNNVGRRAYRWCAQCCRKKKSKIQQGRRKKRNCFKRLKEKWRRRESKKRTDSKAETSVIPVRRNDPATATPLQEKHAKHGKADTSELPTESRRKRDSITRAISDTSARTFETKATEVVKGLAPEIDFTKSCCYLCAKNTMAIAAAMANNVEKLHISIQASVKEIYTSDKSCSPSINVRTVQSSVKVKTRDMSTSHTDEKRNKKPKPKLKLKNLNVFPKLKLNVTPKMRTVGCETDKAVRCNNLPQCRAKRATHCVREANMKQNNAPHTDTQ